MHVIKEGLSESTIRNSEQLSGTNISIEVFSYSDNIMQFILTNSVTMNIMKVFVLIICLLGLVGNGMVIWLLGFRIKRNSFTTYILNLAIADSGVLISLFILTMFSIVLFISYFTVYRFAIFLYMPSFYSLVFELFFFMYSSGQFLLAAISIDRCVAILLPLWHRCHKPPRLSAIVCAVIWIISFLLSVIHFTCLITGKLVSVAILLRLLVNAFFVTPLMVVSTLTLFIKVCCKSQQRRRGKLVTVILLTLLFFLIFAFPLNAVLISTYADVLNGILMQLGIFCTVLNSSINPVIYFLVGRRQKKGRPRVSMEIALQRVFKDDEDCVEEQNATAEAEVELSCPLRT
ncbi:mas-related G-protein coupled receptor member H-like [Hemicordylus capensis]|uniref:mas-related G-protein coupled receptor member H-like n=1 Tax=Hemicordylus capensis TaxID=884348 RepID=UPI002302DD44|nr:mas-related G-protein coupled receptor member H-like [Hemicordylus capensis]